MAEQNQQHVDNDVTVQRNRVGRFTGTVCIKPCLTHVSLGLPDRRVGVKIKIDPVS